MKYLKTQDKNHFSGYKKLKDLFTILNDGEYDIDIPLLNGGLFDYKKAELLTTIKLINNEQLLFILESLLMADEEGIFERDFKSLSVKHIGYIYENLLDFDFKLVIDDMYYVIYQEGNKEKDGYFDIYDYNENRCKNQFYMKRLMKKEILFFPILPIQEKKLLLTILRLLLLNLW